MSRFCKLILILLIGIELPVYRSYSEERVWVMFSDKGPQPDRSAMDAYEALIPRETRVRRQKAQGGVVDFRDLPVFQPYIDGVLGLSAKLCTVSRWLNGITVEVPSGIIPKIAQLPYVRSIEPVATLRYRKSSDKNGVSAAPGPVDKGDPGSEFESLKPYYGASATQIGQIHVDALHDRGYHGEGIVIALLDTGFDLSHESLRNVRVRGTYDFINGDSNTSDEPPEDDIGQDDHGTEVLSIIAGESVGNFVGVAYSAEYLLAKTEKVSERGLVFEHEVEEDWWVAGLEWAELNGADVVSSSLGYSDWYSYRDMNGRTAKTTIAANIAVEKGVIVVVSAGNEGKSPDWPYISAPADGFDVVAVGAVNSMGEIADFSSIGPTYDGRIKPDLVAMGEGTYVADPNGTKGYRRASGTSMATPLVAGTLALLKQALPEFSEPKTLVKLAKYTAGRALNPDNRYGWGIINAESAFRFAKFPGSMKELSAWDPASSVPGSDQTVLYPNPVPRRADVGRLNIRSLEPMDGIEIYNISGALVFRRQGLSNARFIVWDLRNEHEKPVASGVYICVIKDASGNIISIKKFAVK